MHAIITILARKVTGESHTLSGHMVRGALAWEGGMQQHPNVKALQGSSCTGEQEDHSTKVRGRGLECAKESVFHTFYMVNVLCLVLLDFCFCFLYVVEMEKWDS